MGGMFERPESEAPRVIPGFEFLPGLLEQLGGQAQQHFGNVFNPGQVALGPLADLQQGLLSAYGTSASSILPMVMGAFGQGLNTGFAPDVTQQVEAQLLPALERSFTRGKGAIAEHQANMGTLTSSGHDREVTDLRGGLESNLLSQLAGISGQGALQGQNVMAQLVGQGLGLPASVIAALNPAVGQALQSGQFMAGQPLNALNTIAGGASATPMYQPTFGASKGEQLLGGAAQGAMGFFTGNPAAMMGGIGNMAGGLST